MPASSLSKLALHLSRFANWQAQQAAHQTANTFKSGLGSSSGGSAASSLSGVGAGPGGAKFHAGRGAHYSYTNSGGRAVVQAGSSGTSDGNTHFDDDDEHHASLQHLSSVRRSRTDRHASASSSNSQRQSAAAARLAQLEREAAAKGIDLNSNSLNKHVLQLQFRQAIAAAKPEDSATSIEHKQETDAAHAPPVLPLVDASSKTAEIHRDLLDARDRKDRIAVVALVEAYRQLPSSQKTTAGFNAALQAQLTVRHTGESLRDVRETHKDMLDTGCLPNSSTSAVLVKALCARDQEKAADETAPAVAAEAEASSEAWRIASTCPAGLQDVAAYNALIGRCVAKGDFDRALAAYKMLRASSEVGPNADTYLAILPGFGKLPIAADATEASQTLRDERLDAAKSCLQEAIAAMRSPNWVNNQDSEVFQTYIDVVFHLQAPDEAIDLFQRLIRQEEGLAAPAAHVTGALIQGFIEIGDFATALSWIERIEALNQDTNASSQTSPIVAAPDFAELKQVVTDAIEATRAEQQEQDQQEPSSDSSVMMTPVTSPDVASTVAAVEARVASPSIHEAEHPSSAFGERLSQAPALGTQGLQVIDCDLGERVKSMIRIRKGYMGGANKASTSPNLEGAYRLLMSEASVGNYAPPEVFAQLLNSFGRDGKLHRVHELRDHAHIAVAGLAGDLAWQASAFAEVEDNVISALAHGGDIEGAHAVRHAMLSNGTAPSASSYAALISSIRDSTDEAMLAEQLYEESKRFGVRPNIYLVNTVISRLGRARRADKALQLYESLPRLGLKPTSITYGASLNCAVRVGDVQTAEAIFRAMEADPSFVARPPGYNSMIQFFTYTQPDRKKALEYWQKMQARGVRPSSHTYKLLLDVHGAIEPVQTDAMNALFGQLLRDCSVEVTGPHWASLIDCYGNRVGDVKKAQEIFRSIALKTGSKPDAVAYEALLQVYARHGEVNLIDALLAEMIKAGVPRTAYIANQAIDGYSKHGGVEGLMKARAIFLAMSQPPAGVASMGNHPLPRHHGAGATAGSAYFDRRSDVSRQAALNTDIHHFLNQTSSHATDSSVMSALSLEERLAMCSMAFEIVHPEPSTYEKMIQVEMSNGQRQNAAVIVQRMEDRAFPAALVIKARSLLNVVGDGGGDGDGDGASGVELQQI